MRMQYLNFMFINLLFFCGHRSALGYNNLSKNTFKSFCEFSCKSITLAEENDAKLILQEGIYLFRTEQFELALEKFKQALELYERASDHSNMALTLNNIGEVYRHLGQYNQALNFYQKALLIRQEIRDRQGEGRTLNSIGLLYQSQSQYPQALEFYQQALSIIQALNDKAAEGTILNNIGGIYRQTGKHLQAIETYKQALEIHRALNDFLGEGVVLSNLGVTYFRLGEYSQSLALYQKALEIFTAHQAKSKIATVLNNIGEVYADIGQLTLALDVYKQALALYISTGNFSGQAASFQNIGRVYYALGDFSKALEFYQKSLRIREKIGDLEGIGTTLNTIGLTKYRLGEIDQALEYLRQALAIRKQTGNLTGEGVVLNNLGLVSYTQGNRTEALGFYRQALVIYEEVGYKEGGRITFSNIGFLFEKANKPRLAIAFYKKAVNILEDIRQNSRTLSQDQQESYKSKISSTYRTLASLLLEQGRILEAQEVLELLKAEELRDFTRNPIGDGETNEITFNEVEEEILAKHGTLIAFGQRVAECEETRCSKLNELLDQQTLITQQFNQIIARLETEVRTRRSQDTAFLDPEDLGRKAQEIVEAQPGTVLIYPFVLEDKIWLLWASQGGIVKTVEVPVAQKELAQTVLRFRQQLQNPDSSIKRLRATSQKLYNWLIQPIEPELKANNIKNLVFSLDRATRYIPMSALYDGEEYLIENYTVSTILSADLTDTRDRLPAGVENVSILAMGLSNAVEGFNPLPNVLEEIDAVVRTDARDSKGVYPGFAFLNDAFDFRTLRNNLRGNQILHLATHGDFKPGRPEESYLVLGTGEKLAIPEISTLRYLNNVHLVVLSACETALGGEGTDGVEINGISYYFLNQGAKAVVASLWLVNDASTAQLMQGFYGNLAGERPIAKAEALRQAQLKMLRDERLSEEEGERGIVAVRPVGEVSETEVNAFGFSHPYYWAAFILIGNGF